MCVFFFSAGFVRCSFFFFWFGVLAQDLGFRVSGSWLVVQDSGFKFQVSGSKCKT